ncbi:MAG: hypothetical protein CMO81_00195 [Waddliaceae bacterium]|nr:hypothetical protein [Waddliaceae bacterium]
MPLVSNTYSDELQALGVRSLRRIKQEAAVKAVGAVKNMFKNYHASGASNDLYEGDLDEVFRKMKIDDEAQKAKKAFCEVYLSVVEETLKQGGCIILSGYTFGAVSPLNMRGSLEFTRSLADSEASTRRQQLAEATSDCALRVVGAVVTPKINSLLSQKSEIVLRTFCDTVFDTSPEDGIEQVIEEPVKRFAAVAVNVIPENNFLDSRREVPIRQVKKEDTLLDATVYGFDCALGGIYYMATLPVYYMGEEELVSSHMQGYADWVNSHISGSAKLRNPYK